MCVCVCACVCIGCVSVCVVTVFLYQCVYVGVRINSEQNPEPLWCFKGDNPRLASVGRSELKCSQQPFPGFGGSICLVSLNTGAV